MTQTIKRFWCVHTCIFHWLLIHHPFKEPLDIERQHILDYIDHRLEAGLSVSTVNYELRCLQAVLRYLQEQDYAVSQAVLRLPGLKTPERLPRFLTDEQVSRLRDELERQVAQAQTGPAKRDALLEQAAFYLLWQGGMRLGEVEDLLLANLDISAALNTGQAGGRLTVRQGKGRQDRTVYLAERAVAALKAYLDVRGAGSSDHVFLYRARPLCKDLIRDRLKAAGQRVGVKVSPHQLRHTCATQLLNAGCRVTSIQKLLGHRRLNSTMVYARVHDRTVAEDYYTAMDQIEKHLDMALAGPAPTHGNERVSEEERAPLLALVNQLADPHLGFECRLDLVEQMRRILNPVRQPAPAPNGRDRRQEGLEV